jgi:outer membrane protein
MTKKLLALLMMVFLAVPVVAQEEDHSQQIRFGYLSYDSALVRMADYAIVQANMAALRSAYEAEMQRVEDEFNQKYEAFLEGQRDFPRTILLKRQTELQELLQRNIAFKKQGLDDLQKAEREAMAPLRQRLDAAIARVAAQQGLALVLNTDANACPFISPAMGVDVTEAVTAVLNVLR